MKQIWLKFLVDTMKKRGLENLTYTWCTESRQSKMIQLPNENGWYNEEKRGW